MNALYTVIRKLVRKQKNISREQAIIIAQRECQRKGWAWKTPIHIAERLNYYWIWTNADYRGGNCSLTVDLESGHIIQASLIRY